MLETWHELHVASQVVKVAERIQHKDKGCFREENFSCWRTPESVPLQNFMVPVTAAYLFTVAGAQGGTGNAMAGGLGATVTATAYLQSGFVVSIVVAGRGSDGNDQNGSGGGGLSAVYTDDTVTPTIVAGLLSHPSPRRNCPPSMPSASVASSRLLSSWVFMSVAKSSLFPIPPSLAHAFAVTADVLQAAVVVATENCPMLFPWDKHRWHAIPLARRHPAEQEERVLQPEPLVKEVGVVYCANPVAYSGTEKPISQARLRNCGCMGTGQSIKSHPYPTLSDLLAACSSSAARVHREAKTNLVLCALLCREWQRR